MKHLTSTALAVVLATVGFAGGAQAQAEREFRIGMITPPAHVWNQEAAALGETLSELSDGRFSIAVFPSGQLGNESTMLQQLQTGALDMAWLTTAEVTTRVPDIAALHAPFLVEDIEGAAAILRSEPAQEMLEKLPAATGTVGPCFAMTGMRQLLTRDAIDDVGELAGKRFRITPAPAIRTFFEELGAAPAPMPLTQVYDALANGQIDAIVREAVQTHCDRIIDRFVAEEAGKLERLKAVDGLAVTEDVGPEFFGDVVARWDAMWAKETPYVARLRELAAGL